MVSFGWVLTRHVRNLGPEFLWWIQPATQLYTSLHFFFLNDCCLKQLIAVMMVMWMIIIDRITYYPSIRCLWFILTLFLMILLIYCDHMLLLFTVIIIIIIYILLFHFLIMMILKSNQRPIIWFMINNNLINNQSPILMWMVIIMMFNDDEGGSGVTGADSRPVWLAWFEPRRLLEPLVSAGRDGGCCFPPKKTSAKQEVLGGRPGRPSHWSFFFFFFEILNMPKIAQIYPMAPDEYLILVTDFSGQG